MSKSYKQILRSLNAKPKTQADLAHLTGCSFKTVRTMIQKLIREELAYVHSFIVYPNGRYKSTYCAGKKPTDHVLERPNSKTIFDFNLDVSSVKMVLPASCSDICSYFEWEQEYVKKVTDHLVETYIVDKVQSGKPSLKDPYIFTLTTVNSVAPVALWPGWNEVSNPNVINGVEIRTTWRHQLTAH